jgi:putative membrane protein
VILAHQQGRLERGGPACHEGGAPLTDQQLAGVIMWIPAGRIYLVTALALMVQWVHATKREDVML